MAYRASNRRRIDPVGSVLGFTSTCRWTVQASRGNARRAHWRAWRIQQSVFSTSPMPGMLTVYRNVRYAEQVDGLANMASLPKRAEGRRVVLRFAAVVILAGQGRFGCQRSLSALAA
jgi:hypothetical protein